MNKSLLRILPALALIATAFVTATGESTAEIGNDITAKNQLMNSGQTRIVPKVLIIGDSISLGYTAQVRNRLHGIAEVNRPKENCKYTGYGLANIKTWLGTNKWDVIHFNFGIWDTHILDSDGNLLSRTMAGDNQAPEGNLRIRCTPEEYGTNLTQLVEILKGTGTKLIWASTTPIMY